MIALSGNDGKPGPVCEWRVNRFCRANGHGSFCSSVDASAGADLQNELRFASPGLSPTTARKFLEPSLRLFSFNNPMGPARTVAGFGDIEIDYELALPDARLNHSRRRGEAVADRTTLECQRDLLKQARKRVFRPTSPFASQALCNKSFVDLTGNVREGDSLMNCGSRRLGMA